MQIGILADIHDNLEALHQALEQFRNAEVLLCCGDLCSPFVVETLGRHYQGEIHIVFGNNDGDLFRITRNSAAYPGIQLHGEMAELTLEGCRFGLTHFDDVARVFAETKRYDVVCFGHNHQYEVSRVEETLLINPGEVFGGLTGQSTCVSFDTAARTSIRHELN